MSSATRWQSEHWRRPPRAVNESGSTCWLWLPTWVTSTSTPPTGTWKPHPNSCATSPSLPRTLFREDGHDFPRTAHRGFPPRASDPPPWRQPTHVRFLCLQLSVLVRVRLQETQSGAFGSDAGAVGRGTDQLIP